jgi:transposase-like protein
MTRHPIQHKHAAVRFLYNRLHTYDLEEDAKSKELNTIHNILHNNMFPLQTYNFASRNMNINHTLTQPQTHTHKWAIFTYVRKETRFITQIFKNTNLKIAYKVNNTTETLSKAKPTHFDKYSACGIYKFTCPDCGKAYVGQTGRSFSVHYKKHRHSFRTNNTNSNFAQHLLDNAHNFAPIDSIMHILEFQKKSKHMNTLERYYIHKEAYLNSHLNDQHTIIQNKIFEIISSNKKFWEHFHSPCIYALFQSSTSPLPMPLFPYPFPLPPSPPPHLII